RAGPRAQPARRAAQMNADSVPVNRPVLVRVQRPALIVGVAAYLLSLAGVALDHEQFFRSYLVAYIFWSGLTFGALALVLLVLLAGGLWGISIRRVLEAAANTLPLVAVLFVPLLFGVGDLYPWSRGDVSGPTQAAY